MSSLSYGETDRQTETRTRRDNTVASPTNKIEAHAHVMKFSVYTWVRTTVALSH